MTSNQVAEVNPKYLAEQAEKVVPVGYKKTEVGVIPEDWEVLTLGGIGSFKNGINKDADDFGYGSPFVNLMDVFGKPAINSVENLGLINATELDKKEYSLKKGDVLFIRSSVKPTGVGLTSVVLNELIQTVYSGFLIRFRSGDKLDIIFKEYCFYDEGFRKRIIAGSTVSANTNINQDVLKAIPLAFPRLVKEQNAIANALSDVDALLDKLEKLIVKKQAIKTATMQQLLTGRTRLPQFVLREDGSPTNSSGTNLDAGTGGPKGEGREAIRNGYKKSELGEIPEDWDVVELGKIAKINMGQSPSSRNYNDNGMGMPLVQGNADISERKTIVRNYTTQITKTAKKGDLILSVRAPVGEVARAMFDCCIGRGVCAIQYKNEYLYHWLISFESEWDRFSKGSTFDSINSDELREIKLIIPTDKEQDAIATILSDMDTDLQALEQRLNKTRQIKQGMMQQLLTGKIRLV